MPGKDIKKEQGIIRTSYRECQNNEQLMQLSETSAEGEIDDGDEVINLTLAVKDESSGDKMDVVDEVINSTVVD